MGGVGAVYYASLMHPPHNAWYNKGEPLNFSTSLTPRTHFCEATTITAGIRLPVVDVSQEVEAFRGSRLGAHFARAKTAIINRCSTVIRIASFKIQQFRQRDIETFGYPQKRAQFHIARLSAFMLLVILEFNATSSCCFSLRQPLFLTQGFHSFG